MARTQDFTNITKEIYMRRITKIFDNHKDGKVVSILGLCKTSGSRRNGTLVHST